MARKHEHFGLGYLEELRILRERENICRASRKEFLRFKQAAGSAPPPPSLKVEAAESLEITEPSSSPSSASASYLLPVPGYFSESGTSGYSEKVGICSAADPTDQGLPIRQNKSHKKGIADKTDPEDESESQEDEPEKVSVAIASLVGTSKKITMLKKPERPARAKYKKFVRVRSAFKKSPTSPQKRPTEAEKHGQKAPFQQRIPVIARPSIVTTESSDSVASTASEKYLKVSEELVKPSLLSSVLELDEAYSRRSSDTSSVRSISEFVTESMRMSRSDALKVQDRSFPQGRMYSRLSFQKMPSAAHPRSIDEIITSLQSTAPTPSDLKIKELLQSILGQDYNINLEVGELEPAKCFGTTSLKEVAFISKATDF